MCGHAECHSGAHIAVLMFPRYTKCATHIVSREAGGARGAEGARGAGSDLNTSDGSVKTEGRPGEVGGVGDQPWVEQDVDRGVDKMGPEQEATAYLEGNYNY